MIVAAAPRLLAVPADAVVLRFGPPSIARSCPKSLPPSYVLSMCCVCVHCTLS